MNERPPEISLTSVCQYGNTYCILLDTFSFLDYFVFNYPFLSVWDTASYSCVWNTIISSEPLPVGKKQHVHRNTVCIF